MALLPPQLACRLPARVQGYPWRLAYSTVKHGTSLKTLYRSLADVDSPVLLVIKDMDNQVGATVCLPDNSRSYEFQYCICERTP